MADEKQDQGSELEASPIPSGEPPVIIDTRELFGEFREICLQHEGERYRLRITRKGRLILCK